MESKTVIVFDDEDIWCVLFKRIFKRNQISTKTYPSPKKYFCQNGRFDSCPVDSPCADFLLTDHMMPDMTGLDFLRTMKRMQCKIPDTCKAIISSHWTEEAYKEAKTLCVHVFDKSNSKEQLSLWVEKSHLNDFQ